VNTRPVPPARSDEPPSAMNDRPASCHPRSSMNPMTGPGLQSPAIPAQPAASTACLPAADRIEVRIFEIVKTEWGVAYEQGGIMACESEQAARQLQAASGGELVYRRTWITSWV
jgi:hypothetical protein